MSGSSQLAGEGDDPRVWPCAWWNNNTSAISLPSLSVGALGAHDESDPSHAHTLANSSCRITAARSGRDVLS
jgi:hypothetical protein